MKRRFFFKSRSLHENPVVDKILRKREDGLCEKAAGLATVFQVVTDFDIALLYSRVTKAPDCLFDENLAKMADILYKAVLLKFSIDLEFTKATYLWEVNAEIVTSENNKIRSIRRLAWVYTTLEQEIVVRILKSYENFGNDTKKFIENLIRTRYEV